MSKVCCSIEMEPRTLSTVKLNHAREMAADVVQKMESNEASASFIEELRPLKEMEEEGDHQQVENKLILELKDEEVRLVDERPLCQCLCANADMQTPEQEKLKEPLSAPF